MLGDPDSFKVQSLSPAAKGKGKAVDNNTQPKKRRGAGVPESNA
jgi:hypothetical protein